MTLLVRDEADVVAATIEHHLAAGVDRVIATDHSSVDGTDAILTAYEKIGALELHRQDERAFRQAEWVTSMARRAASRFDADWVINADADEFLWPTEGLKDHLGALTASALVIERDNLVEDPMASGSWPSRLILRDPSPLNAMRRRIAPKIAHRGDPEVRIEPGNHRASGPRIGRPSVVSQFWLFTCWSVTRPRWTLARISSAVAVHTNGFGSSL